MDINNLTKEQVENMDKEEIVMVFSRLKEAMEIERMKKFLLDQIEIREAKSVVD